VVNARWLFCAAPRVSHRKIGMAMVERSGNEDIFRRIFQKDLPALRHQPCTYANYLTLLHRFPFSVMFETLEHHTTRSGWARFGSALVDESTMAEHAHLA
jgi:hypothetical protein